MRVVRLGILVIILLPAGGVRAEPPLSPVDKARIEYLVEKLASTNKSPGDLAPFFNKYPPEYNKDAQVIVYLAIQQLLNEGAAAFDILIARFDDPRYSHAVELPSSVIDAAVGSTCKSIVLCNLLPYKAELETISPEQLGVS